MTITAIAATSNLVTWISPQTMRALAWSLLHFLWQGTAIAAVAASAMAMIRRSTARYAIGVAALALMLITPVATFLLGVSAPRYSGVADTAKSSPLAAVARPIARGHAAAASGSTIAQASPLSVPSLDTFPWLVEAWLVGVAFFSLRSAGGFFLLERERRRKASLVNGRILEICYALQDQLGIRRAIQYCECKWLQAPAVIGWFRPIVFLPATALTGLSEDQLQSVIAHELAHIRRFDPFVNVFQIAVESLLFYHPAVWWLNKRIRAEREHCCDEMAVTLCGNAVEYARALTLMEEWRSAPIFAAAANGGPLKERILRVLGLKTLGTGVRGIGVAGSILCLTAALVAGDAFLEMTHPASVRVYASALGLQSAMSAASAQSTAKSTPSSKPSPAHAQSAEATTSASSYVDAMRSVGLTDLSVDQLVALKTQDVTPEYVRGLQEQGIHVDVDRLISMRVQDVTPEYVHAMKELSINVDADRLVSMRVQDITPEYVRELRDAGLNADADHLISLKVQDADAAYYRAMKDAGLNPDVDHLISLKVQDVTPEYVRDLRAAGFDITVDKVISLKVQNVTPAYLKQMHDLGINARTDDLIGMKVQDVTPEYVRAIQALGFKPTAQEIISLKVQDVTPEYIKALQTAGFNVRISDIISAKVQDVTPEFINEAKKHGFKDLTLQKLIQLRQLGILDAKADI
ncbi:MAG TPA: M56 family metallopeptidase [Candidatus Solibacter sp.]|nr:M56 family metallopeptidase [Candidatus Solibacter sp.]